MSDTTLFADAAFGNSATLLHAEDHAVPHYLRAHYWWAYIHPKAVRLFERQWLVNLILWGNYAQLRDAALAELGESLAGRTLQVACVYGDLTSRLCGQVASGGGAIDIARRLADTARIIFGRNCRKTPRQDCCRWTRAT